MRRAPLVLAGTAVGLGLLLTYRTPPLAASTAAATTGTNSSAQSTGTAGSGSGGGSGSTASGGGTGSGGNGGSASSGSTSATGTSVFNGYGNVQVKVTVSGGKITSVTNVQLPNRDPQSQSISGYAGPQLIQQAMAAQSAHINGVSGATYTSQAFAQSLQSALTQLGDVTPMSSTTHVEHVMGTAVTFEVVAGDVSPATVDDAIVTAVSLLHDVDDTFSLWQSNSPMSRLQCGELTLSAVPIEIGEVLLVCESMRQMTGGWFDARRMPHGIDPTGYVKGWAAQRALDVIRDAGAEAALINAGGDAVGFGWPAPHRPWRLGVRDPLSTAGLIGVVALEPSFGERAALATSGTYERGEHLIDPATGLPATAGVLSASVVGPDLGVADALATALSVGGRACASVLDAPGYSALLLHADGSRTVIGNFRLLPMPSYAATGIPPFLAEHRS